MLAFAFMTSTDQTARAVYEDALRSLGHKRRACAARRRLIWSDVLGTVAAAVQLDDIYAARVRRVAAQSRTQPAPLLLAAG